MPESIYLVLISLIPTLLLSSRYGFELLKIFSFFSICIYSFASGFRDIGADTYAYNLIYQNEITDLYFPVIFKYVGSVESGFYFLMYLSSKLGFDFSWFSFIYTLSCFFVIWFLVSRRYGQLVAAVFIVFILSSYTFYQASFNQVRHLICFVFTLMAVFRLVSKKYISSFFMLFIAMHFHTSVVLLIPVFILYLALNDKLSSIAIIIASPLVYLFFSVKEIIMLLSVVIPGDLVSKFDFYLESDVYGGTAPVNFSLLLSFSFLIILTFLNERVLKFKCRNVEAYELIRFLVFGYFLFFIYADFYILSQRFLYYIDVIYALCLSIVIVELRNLRYFPIVVVFFTVAYLIKTIFSSTSWSIGFA